MSPEHINLHLRLAGYCQQDVARELGFHQTYISMVIRGLRQCQAIEDRIAEILGRPAHQLFQHRRRAA